LQEAPNEDEHKVNGP